MMLTDTDLPMDLGEDCNVINIFTDRKTTIASTLKKTQEITVSSLMPASQSYIADAWLVQAYLLQEVVKDMQLRALISAILGNDTYPGGVYGVGAYKQWEKTTQFREGGGVNEGIMFEKLMEYGVEESKPKPKSTSPLMQ